MDFDYDLRLRMALFDHIAKLQKETGGVVTAAQLNQGLQFEGERIPIWNRQRGIFRPKQLRDRSGVALTVQTSFDSPYDDRSDPSSDRFVYKYQGDDPDQWDNVALRMARETGRPILYLVAVQPGVYQPIFPTYVVEDVPERLSFMLMADTAGTIQIGPEALQLEPLKAYVTREVKTRLHQKRFRYLVLTAYEEQCAMCSLRHEKLLDAAHIIRDKEQHSKPEVPNGLSLCRIHHRAYDVNIVGVDPDFQLHVRGDVLDEIDGPMLKHGLQELHGGRLIPPKRKADQPNRDYLAERFEEFQDA